jgi:hypothetical protein
MLGVSDTLRHNFSNTALALRTWFKNFTSGTPNETHLLKSLNML